MNTFFTALKSRTVWMVVFMFFVGGVAGIREMIPPTYLFFIEGILGYLAIYFRAHPQQDFTDKKK
jgi:RsiW-degrading membrane proteinase PrsW (M82 family)